MSKRKPNRKAALALRNGRRSLDARTRARVAQGRAVEPIEYRATHGAEAGAGLAVEAEPVRLVDSQGKLGTPRRTFDTLAGLLRNGTISPPAQLAGRIFEEDFQAAGLQRLRAAPLQFTPRGKGTETDLVMAARQRVYGALDRLGGIGSPMASALWGTLGEGRTIKNYAASTHGVNGRAPHRELVRGFLIGALYALVGFYRLGPRGSQRRKSGPEKP